MNVAGSIRRTPRMRTWLARSLVAVAAATALSAATTPAAHAGVFVSVNFAPPALPVYVQPAIPAPGYIWTPGYWAYDPISGYYWVPGTWVLPPYTGALWTPGYWGWGGGVYAFHPGYWGLHVGYYGGINYGFGYGGVGYLGGYWGPRGFYYNREVNRITNVNITNVYNKTVVVNNNVTRVSYNGPGGITTRATAEEMRYASERHTPAIAAQMQHQTMASRNEAMRASVNHGNPTIAATARPNAFMAQQAGHAAVSNSRAEMRSANYAQHQNQGVTRTNFAEHKQVVHGGGPTTNYSTQSYVQHNSTPAMNAHSAPVQHGNSAPHVNAERAPSRAPAHEGKNEHR